MHDLKQEGYQYDSRTADTFLLHYTADGFLDWSRFGQGYSYDQIQSLAYHPSHFILALGSFQDDLLLGAGEINERTINSISAFGGFDIFIASYSRF
jgi:hypothetical protein